MLNVSKINCYTNYNNKNVYFGGRILKGPQHIPHIAVVDFFNWKFVDINGNGIPDLSHGKFCKTIIKSVLPNANVETFRLKGYKGHTGDEDMTSVAKKFHSIAQRIKNGEHFDAVSFSFGNHKSFDELSKFLGKKITRNNINEHRKELKQFILDLSKPENKKLAKKFDPGKTHIKDMYKVFDAIEEVTSQNVPVYIAAGNSGKKYMNLYSLADGATTVKAFEGDKAKPRIGYFSCNNALTKKGERGIYYITRSFDKNGKLKGYKVLENSKYIIKAKEISNRKPIVDKFIGKNVKDILAKENDYKLLEEYKKAKFSNSKTTLTEKDEKHLGSIVFEINKYIDILVKARKRKMDALTKSYYIRHAKYLDKDFSVLLNVDKDGKIIADPEHKGLTTLNFCWGTSYATPRLAAEDVAKKYAKNSK